MADLTLPTIILFYEKMDHDMLKIFENVQEALKDRAVFVKLDVNRNPESFLTFKIGNIPTIVAFLNGRELWRISGEFSEEIILSNFNEIIEFKSQTTLPRVQNPWEG